MSTDIAPAPLNGALDLFANDMDVDFQRPAKNGTPSASRIPSPTPSSSSHKLEDVPNEQLLHDDEETKPKPARNGKKAKATPPPTQDISHLPVARDEALATFESLKDNWYQYNTLGKSREALESMTCDCSYEHGVDDPMDACGPHSDCINRLTQVECLPDDCRCRRHCQNQRFQRKQYGSIEVVLTEKKGFGLRAEADLPQDTFIYEYIGDVVSQPSFMKRMRDYANEGIRHFYFMMLQKDEFVDATKRGGIGRFANHSCNPNCYVAKWTIGERVRMGIFAKRNIAKGEELTFNYNVDRYGHEAQTCYCGEPNCVGFIGGKTQTDVVTVDDIYLDALGISDADRAELKGNRKKKGKKLDDPDFQPTLSSIQVEDIPKIVQAIRQPPSKRFLIKILTRVKITTDEPALRQLMRLRGFSMMTNIFNDYAKETDVIVATLECMQNWPLVTRNKVDDSKITEPVASLSSSENETIKELAQKLLDHWANLQIGYRIPKRKLTAEEIEAALKEPEEFTTELSPHEEETDDKETEEVTSKRARLSTGTKTNADYENRFRPNRMHNKRPPTPPPLVQRRSLVDVLKVQQENLAAVLRAAAQQAEEEAARRKQEEEEKAAAEEKERERLERKKKEKERTKNMTAEEREAEKEALKFKRLQKLIAQVVNKSMSKYAKDIPRDSFKKYSQELTLVIAEKEKNSSMYKENKLESLTPEKVEKIKKFAKPYIQKVLHKLKKHSKHRSRPKDGEAPAPTESPSVELADGVVDMQMEEEMEDMDMDVDDPSDDEGSAKPSNESEPPPESVTPVSPDEPTDPRLRTADPRRPTQDSLKSIPVDSS